jgi:YHS domain-containing protein
MGCASKKTESEEPMPSIRTADPVNTTEEGVAIHGYDPVAYFLEGRPRIGHAAFAYTWNGATWHFSSASNRDLFAGDPEKYAPQYGGYCSFAASMGQAADASPRAWKIIDGKLYLNFNRVVHKVWEILPGRLVKADRHWAAARD